ncbi:MAG TPA: arginine repressor [Acidimicrobiia bacterium]
MTPSAATRRRLVRRLIDGEEIASQQQLVQLLADAGYPVTQATVSRDLDALGAVKERKANGHTTYVIDDERYALTHEERSAGRALVDFVESISVSGNLVVLRTPPGAAHFVASTIDGAAIRGILGTVAGDDTLVIVASEDAGGGAVAKRLEQMGAG